ncbi:MAG TPA: hypothetical protein VGS07_02960 [Thermoanaerobaculia bacterium]|jgi:uncharacterized protein with von Willebrand factor type A (vWA) domain|nr:hypothetical protein [Thermoanaerobaculia bacterium]
MTEAEDAALEARALELAAEVEALAAKLRDFHDGIPVSPSEAVMLLGEEDMDFATALRSTIECVLADRLEPTAVELKKWAAYRPPAREKK